MRFRRGNVENVLQGNKKNVLLNRNYVLLLLGQMVSNIGNAIHSAAVAWFIMSLVGEKSAGTFMGIFGMCNFIPMIIFGPISGVFVDKFDRKKIIVGTDLIRGSLMLILAIFTYLDIFTLPTLFIMTVLSAILGTLFNPAVDASIPNIVEEELLTKANSINGTVRQLTWIAGAAISGFLYYSIGIVGIFLVNGISFILSGLSEMFINIPPTKRSEIKGENNRTNFWKDFKDGVTFIKNQKVIIILLSFFLVINFLFNPIFQIVFPKTIKFTLEMTAREFGILQSIFSVGSILGMLLLTILPKREKVYGMMTLSTIMHGVLMTLIGVPLLSVIYSSMTDLSILLIIGLLLLTMGIFNALLNVPLFTVFQKIVPDEYRGRFFGILGTLSQGIVPVGLAIMGTVSDLLHPATIFIGGGLIVLILSIWMAMIPEIKEL